MPDALKWAGFILCLVALAVAAVAVAATTYYLRLTLANVRPEKRMLLPFMAPLALLLPQFWTERGNVYRKRLFLSIAMFAICVFIMAIIKSAVDNYYPR
jgi:hypothetical protein